MTGTCRDRALDPPGTVDEPAGQRPRADLEGDITDGMGVAVPAFRADHPEAKSWAGRVLSGPGTGVDRVHDGLLTACAPTGRSSDAPLTLPPSRAQHMYQGSGSSPAMCTAGP